MLPTLRPEEGVMIDPDIDKRKLHIGDIIVYQNPSKGNIKNIIHRVINVCEYGYKTCGDNNRRADDYIVKFEFVLGKAISVKRGTKTFPLSEGSGGFQTFLKLQRKKLCLSYLLKPLSFLSQIVDKSRVFILFHRFIKVDVIKIRKGKDFEEILIHNKKLIGKKYTNMHEWKIKFPYKYFIDKKKI